MEFSPVRFAILRISSESGGYSSGYDTINAEKPPFKEILKNIIRHSLEPSQLGEVLAQYQLDVDEKSQSPRAGHWVPVINKVAAGYPASFDDLGYPVGFADDYVRCPDIHDTNAFEVRVVGDRWGRNFERRYRRFFTCRCSNGEDCFVRFKPSRDHVQAGVFRIYGRFASASQITVYLLNLLRVSVLTAFIGQ